MVTDVVLLVLCGLLVATVWGLLCIEMLRRRLGKGHATVRRHDCEQREHD